MPDPESRATVAAHMREIASTWVESLSEDQRRAGWWAGPQDDRAETERVRWFYTPTDHGGLTLAAQRPVQQQLVMRLVAAGLSPAGYVTLSTVMGWENVLDLVEDYSQTWGRERARDPGLYYARVFGDPRRDTTWAWRLGGHHISLNFLVADGEVRATTPCFLGADPASAPSLGGASIRPLAQAEDLARQLVRSLDREQFDRALLSDRAPTDIVSGNRSRVSPGDRMLRLPEVWRGRFADPALDAQVRAISDATEAAAGLGDDDHAVLALSREPKGLSGAQLDAGQRELLALLLATYTGRVRPALAPDLSVEEVHLAWAGSTDPGEPHYYRLQGPGILAEWDNTQRRGNHAHSVWRDPDNDFGLDVLAAHRAAHHTVRAR